MTAEYEKMLIIKAKYDGMKDESKRLSEACFDILSLRMGNEILQKHIDELEQKNEKLKKKLEKIAGMCGNPDAVDAPM